MYVYDIKPGTWKVGGFSYPTTVNGATIYIKLSIKNFGGIASDGRYQNENSYNICLTEDANSISSFTSGNKFPPVSKFSTVHGENNERPYFLGGTGKKEENVVYNMTITTMKMNDKFKIDRLEHYDDGCLTYYEKYLIYSFGSKKDNYSNKTQLIRLSSKLLADKFTKETMKLSYKDSKTNTGAIIGGSVGGIMGLKVIFGGILYVYFRRNKMRKKGELGTPEYIREIV